MSKGLLGTLYWYLEVNITTTSTNQISQPDSRQILRHQYGISVAESQTFSWRNILSGEEQGRSLGSFPK